MADQPKFYLQWNLVNWITVALMVFSGMIVMGFVSSALRQYAQASRATAVNDD